MLLLRSCAEFLAVYPLSGAAGHTLEDNSVLMRQIPMLGQLLMGRPMFGGILRNVATAGLRWSAPSDPRHGPFSLSDESTSRSPRAMRRGIGNRLPGVISVVCLVRRERNMRYEEWTAFISILNVRKWCVIWCGIEPLEDAVEEGSAGMNISNSIIRN